MASKDQTRSLRSAKLICRILQYPLKRPLTSTLIWRCRPFRRRPNTCRILMKLIVLTTTPRSRLWWPLRIIRRLLIQGYHGTGKSTHVEQVAARLNWPCIRVNLDSHISRIDLIGKDAIVLKDGKQVTEFRDGILPWALQSPIALVFDEYDAGRPDVMFVIQRVLEVDGKMTLLDQNRVLRPHPAFRLLATANTVGLGDTTGLYHGTQQINQGQLDRVEPSHHA